MATLASSRHGGALYLATYCRTQPFLLPPSPPPSGSLSIAVETNAR